MLGGRDSKRLSVLLGPLEGLKALGVHWLFWAEKGQDSSVISPRVRGLLDVSIPKTQAGSWRTGICLGLSRLAQMVLSVLPLGSWAREE